MLDAQTTQDKIILTSKNTAVFLLTRLAILYLNLTENVEIDQYNPFYCTKSQSKRAL